jgi:hypothetical protein
MVRLAAEGAEGGMLEAIQESIEASL